MRGKPSRAAGQALVEALAAALLLVPLWLAVYYISRWHDLQFATIAAARYAALASFVGAGRDDPQRIARETRHRVFSRAEDRFAAGGGGEPADIGDLPQWRSHADDSPLLDLRQGPQVAVMNSPQPAVLEQREEQAFALIAPARAVGSGAFDLQRSAARSAVARLEVGPVLAMAAPLSAQRLVLTESLSLLVDPWAASGRSMVLRRIDSLSPAGQLREWVAPLQPLFWAIEQIEPAAARLCLGRVEPDLVPVDRLSGGSLLRRDLRTVPC